MRDWFKIIVDSEKLHGKFKHLLNIFYSSERELLVDWMNDFVFKDGFKKTIEEFQNNFHSMFWEIYLNKTFLKSGFTISEKIKSPDFCLTKDDKKIFVEAVVSNIAESEPKENERTFQDIYGNNDYYNILDESIVRLYNSFCNKQERYENHYSNNQEIKGSPFVLAVGDYAQINYGQSYYYPLLALLYGAYYDKNDKRDDLKILCEDSLDKEYKFIESHPKKNGAPLKLGLFNDKRNEHISAVIYSCTTTLGKLSSLSKNHIPQDKCIVVDRETYGQELQILRYSGTQPDETLHDGLFVYHNPNAKHKIPEDFLVEKGVTHFRFDEDGETGICIRFNPTHGILKRRHVCMKGMEEEFIEKFSDFHFFPVLRR
ncbi:hypothetical protein [Burkholderia sp. RS02]|uniref:hypothetical protein n=1 Tax=unclassified Burkholderia TaxID=2613784 RepID=UPI0032186801